VFIPEELKSPKKGSLSPKRIPHSPPQKTRPREVIV